MEHFKLVYGKAGIKRITNVEICDDKAILFILNKNYETEQIEVPNRYWILSSKKLKGQWKTLSGNQHYKFGQQYKTRDEFKTHRQLYKQYDTYSIWNEKEAFLVKDGVSYYLDLELKNIPVLSFDIETTGLDPSSPDAKTLLISSTYRNNTKIEKKLFAFDDFPNEKLMIDKWCEWVREKDPSIIIGHNIFSFDFCYLNSRMKIFNSTLDLGRDGSPLFFDRYDSKFRKDQTSELFYRKCHIFGREIADTYFLSIKYDVVAKKYDSYGLKPIIEKEGLVDPNRTFYDASQIRFNYKKPEEWKKIKEYCIDDSDDSLKLFDLMAPSYFYWARSVPKSFQEIVCSATGSQMNSMFVRSYLQDGHSIPKAGTIQNFQGAISWGNPGIYSNAWKLDVKSLYPSIMLQYEIYPKAKDPNKNFLKILEFFRTERLNNKKIAFDQDSKYHEDLSESGKIAINSAYGMLNTAGLNFNDSEQAGKVTELGRQVLEKAIIWATGRKYEEWNPEKEEPVED